MLKINLKDTNYRAKIVQLKNIRKHSNADKLQCVTIDFQTVITGMDAKDGDIYIYFPLECAINKEYLSWSNSFSSPDMNEDKTKKGFFDKNGRVRAVRLRGEPSQGYIIPYADLFDWVYKEKAQFNAEAVTYDIENLIGTEFDSFNDIIICQKYVPKSNKSSNEPKEKRGRDPKISRLVENQFRLHNDTENLRKNIHKLELEDYISIHYKKHGTSWVVGNILVNKQLKWYEKLAKKIGFNIVDKEYDYVYSSRKVVKNEFETKGNLGYYGEDLWADIKEEVKDKIPKGFTLYGEAVGFTKEGKAIQKDYDYGCKPFEMKIYVYKISVVNQDGFTIYLDDKQISEFCEKYGLNYKETFFWDGKVFQLLSELEKTGIKYTKENWREKLIYYLESKYNEKDCYLCVNKVPEEGIVVRKNSLFSYEAYKLKSFRFLQKETEELDKGEVNIEDNVEV